MANYDRFWITPLAGWRNDVRPWKLMDEAFAELRNMYVFRGRVRNRFGGKLLYDSGNPPNLGREQLASRLRVKIGTTNPGTGDFVGNTPNVPALIVTPAVGQAFSIGDTIFTVTVLGTAPPADMLTTGLATGTYDSANGAVNITGNNENPNTDVYFYPSLPVMGFVSYELGSISDEPTFAFDTRMAYTYIAGGWERLETAVPTVADRWTGDNADFFWGTTWRGAGANNNILYVTNFNFGANLNDSDRIRYWDGTAWAELVARWGANATDTTTTARIIIRWKDRLWLLNVVENTGGAPGVNTHYQNRAMFSQAGSPLAADAFRRDIPGRGGFIDCPTKEAIISASLLKDRLIVYFERSTYELAYTGNQSIPAVWQKINAELGAESTFSIVNFDRVVLGIGNVGIHATTGASVERIDSSIPNEVFKIHNENEGPVRVQGVRDYDAEQVYWTFPSSDPEPVFPTRVLVYNYAHNTWAINDDSITAFGYFLNPSDLTWGSWITPWVDSNDPWGAGSDQSLYRQVIAGNQEGYTFWVDTGRPRNAPSLQITDIDVVNNRLKMVNHNLTNEDYVLIENVEGTGGITDINNRIFSVIPVSGSADEIDIEFDMTGVYEGAGTITRVSVPEIVSKEYNFYNEKGRNVFVPRIEFYVDTTDTGELTVESFGSSNPLDLRQEGIATGAILGTQTLITAFDRDNIYRAQQQQVWHSVYFQTDGELFQFRLFLNDEQMTRVPDENDTPLPFNGFTLHAMIIYALPSVDR